MQRNLFTFRILRHLEAFPVMYIRQFRAIIDIMRIQSVAKFRIQQVVATFQCNSEIISTIGNLENLLATAGGLFSIKVVQEFNLNLHNINGKWEYDLLTFIIYNSRMNDSNETYQRYYKGCQDGAYSSTHAARANSNVPYDCRKQFSGEKVDCCKRYRHADNTEACQEQS